MIKDENNRHEIKYITNTNITHDVNTDIKLKYKHINARWLVYTHTFILYDAGTENFNGHKDNTNAKYKNSNTNTIIQKRAYILINQKIINRI